MVKLEQGGTQASISDPDGRGGLAISISQAGKNSTAKWRLSVRAITDQGTFPVGAIVVCPPADGSQAARVVAIATCPGARDWTIYADLIDGVADGAQLELAVGLPTGGGPGVVRIAERYKYYAGSAAAAVNVLAGETVLGWSAFSSGAGASVVIDGGATIPIPNGGSIAGGPGGTLEGPITITFAGANLAGYLVEVTESA